MCVCMYLCIYIRLILTYARTVPVSQHSSSVHCSFLRSRSLSVF